MNGTMTFAIVAVSGIAAFPTLPTFAQWTDMTKPANSKESGVPALAPRLTALTHQSSYHYELAFSPDGKLLVMVSDAGPVPPMPHAGEQRRSHPLGSAAAPAIASGDRNMAGSRTLGRYSSPGGRYLGRIVDRFAGFLVVDTKTGDVVAHYPESPEGTRIRRSVAFYHPTFTTDNQSVFGISLETLVNWNAATRNLSRIAMLDGFRPTCFACSPVESKLVVRNWLSDENPPGGRMICLVDTANGAVLAKMEVPAQHYDSNGMNAGGIAFSPDGKRFAAGLSLWDLKSGKIIRQLSPNRHREGNGFFVKWCTNVKFTRDGKYVVGYGGGVDKILIWDVESGTDEFAFDVTQLHRDDPQTSDSVGSIDFSPDGRWMVSSDREVVHLWHFSRRKLVANLIGSVNDVRDVAFAPDGKTIAAGGSDATTRLWDVSAVTSSIQEADIPPRPSPYFTVLKGNRIIEENTPAYEGLVASADGTLIAAATMEGITVWDMASRTVKGAVPLRPSNYRGRPGGGYLRFSFIPNSTLMAVLAAADEKVHLFDLDSRQDVRTVGEKAKLLAMSPNGNMLACVCDGDENEATPRSHAGIVKIYDVRTAKQAGKFAAKDRISDLRFSPDGKYLAVANDTITLWDTATWSKVAMSEQLRSDVMNFSADGKTLVTQGGGTCFWQIPSLEKQASLEGWPIRCAVSGDLSIAAGGGWGQGRGGSDCIGIWDCKAAKLRGTSGLPPQGSFRPMQEIVLLPGERLLATVHDDDTLMLWDWRAALQQEGWEVP